MTAAHIEPGPADPRLSPRVLAAVALAHGGLVAALMGAPDATEPVTLARPLTVSLIDAARVPPQTQPKPEPRPAPPVIKQAPPVLTAERPLPADAPQPVTEIPEPAPVPEAIAEPVPPAPATAASAPAPVPAPAPLVPPRPADYRTNPKPPYPPLSRRLGEAGTVHLDVLVDPDGNVAQLVLARSSGYPRLDRTAIETVQSSWKFKPAREGGKPVAAWVSVPIQFILRS
jgi:protein TonB